MILAFLLTGGIILERVIHDNSKNKIISNQAAIISAYKNAPVKFDTLHDTIHLPGEVIIKPVPVNSHRNASLTTPDTLVQTHCNASLPTPYYYDSIFKHNSLQFRWRAQGYLKFISFSDFVLSKDVITITRQIDTCIVKPQNKAALIKVGPYVGITLNSFAKFPGIEAGGQLIIKDQITISAGGLYFDVVYGNVRVGWVIR